MNTSVNDQTDRRLESRPDLYSLIGGTPPIAFVKPTYQTKWATKKKAESWTHKPFLNPARTDTLVLHHWVKQSEQDDDYHFAKFNRVIDIVDYTDEDYEQYLTDNDWTKDETDYLFRLCRLYDLRFPVIADRYDYNASTPRSMEDMKERYYSVNIKLIKARAHSYYNNNSSNHSTFASPAEARQSLIQQYTFDKAQEVERKKALIGLYQRTKEQIQEEEILFLETKRMEHNREHLTTQRDQLYSTLHLEQAQQVPSTPLTPLASSSSASSISTSSPSVEEMLPPPPEKKEKLIPGPYVRSQKLPAVKTTLQTSVLQFLADVGIGARPVMPTEDVCYKYDHLQNSVVALLELKKVAEKLDINTKTTIKGRKHSLSVSSASANRSANERRRKLA
ncbi:hypothetical protein [Absidia glauca]|uniref:SWR1-complex protein 4 n=1 Tax=Absidia glauca TaxID=4829 RepID=A0A168T733_ABSGL|nr:hypothetical protein [Absidia glauca]